MPDPAEMTPQFFTPHSNLGDEVNRNIAESELQGGVHLDNAPVGSRFSIVMRDHVALLVKQGESDYLISGHSIYYPEPIPIRVLGSTWGGMMLKPKFIGRGMRFVFIRLGREPDFRVEGEYLIDNNGITTSEILEIEEIH